MIYSFKGFIPVIAESAYIHPLASIVGNVIIGEDVYVGPGAAIRGDWGGIIIKDGCNVQENCTIHMFPGTTVVLEKNAHIGHGAIIHGAHIGENCMVGMNAVIMDDVELGKESIVGALAFIKSGMNVPPRSLLVGNPAKIIKEVSDKMIAWKTKGTQLYQTLPQDCKDHMEEVEPLREMPSDRPAQDRLFEVWDNIKNKN